MDFSVNSNYLFIISASLSGMFCLVMQFFHELVTPFLFFLFFFFLKDGEFISDICGSGFSHFSKMLFMFLFFDNNVSYLSAAWRESRLGVGTQL